MMVLDCYDLGLTVAGKVYGEAIKQGGTADRNLFVPGREDLSLPGIFLSEIVNVRRGECS